MRASVPRSAWPTPGAAPAAEPGGWPRGKARRQSSRLSRNGYGVCIKNQPRLVDPGVLLKDPGSWGFSGSRTSFAKAFANRPSAGTSLDRRGPPRASTSTVACSSVQHQGENKDPEYWKANTSVGPLRPNAASNSTRTNFAQGLDGPFRNNTGKVLGGEIRPRREPWPCCPTTGARGYPTDPTQACWPIPMKGIPG